MGKKIVAAGNVCVDITPQITGRKVSNLNEIMVPGGLVLTEGVTVSAGGSTSNTGLAMKILGGDVAVMCKIGKDDFGEILRRLFAKYGCENDMIVSDGENSSYSIILAVPGIDRIFIHNAGANDSLCLADLNMEKIREAELFHFGYPTSMKAMYENNGAELIKMFRTVSEMGLLTSLDLCVMQEKSEAAMMDWPGILKAVLPYVDFFLPSVEELLQTLDRDKYKEVLERSGGRDVTDVISIEHDVRPLAERCLAMGAKFVLVKCGAPGLYYRTQGDRIAVKLSEKLGRDCSDWVDQEGFAPSYVPEKVRSATGAGDTTIGAFLMAVMDGYPMEKCLQYAAATGASCVETYDTLSGLKSFEELQARMDSGWERSSRTQL